MRCCQDSGERARTTASGSFRVNVRASKLRGEKGPQRGWGWWWRVQTSCDHCDLRTELGKLQDGGADRRAPGEGEGGAA